MIKSVDRNAVIEFQSRGRDDYVVRCTDAGLSAEATVQHVVGDELKEFFGDLAAEWRGWRGVKVFRSLVGTLLIKASADKQGHVALLVVLAYGAPSKWETHLGLTVEAGQLERLADAAEVFCRDLQGAV